MSNVLRNLLYNLSAGENYNNQLTQNQIDYYRGLIVGCVAGLQLYNGDDWYKAIKMIIANLPDDGMNIFKQCIPNGWMDALIKTGDIQ